MPDLIPKQPIHPSILPKLDPQYVEFHNEHFLYLTPPHTLKWNPAFRNAPAVPGGSDPLDVGKVKDFNLTHCDIRTFTPKGDVPQAGWPVFIFFHGGGWTYGNIGAEASFCTNMCVAAQAVVVSVNYRLAPEQPYPAAVVDAIESLDWVVQNGKDELNVNTSRIAVGGSSSGGNLAAVLALKAAERQPPVPLVFQLFVVPVTDNTANTSNLWAENQHAPWLTPDRMLWFRNNYLPNKEDHKKWDASPSFAPDELVKKVPKAWVAVGELDILKDEGVAYAKKMEEQGVEVELVVYRGGPHPIMAMDGALEIGKRLVSDAGKALANAFGTK